MRNALPFARAAQQVILLVSAVALLASPFLRPAHADANPTPTSARAAAPGASSALWIDQQKLSGAGPDARVSLRLRWMHRSGARAYDVRYAESPSGGVIDLGQLARRREVSGIRAKKQSVQQTWIRNLRPGTVYCFSVRSSGRSGWASTRRCKVTMSADRAAAAQAVSLNVGSFNVCSGDTVCSQLPAWSVRAPGVVTRINEMSIAGRAPDALAVVEGIRALPYLNANLTAYDHACASPNGAQHAYVRTDGGYTVVPGTTGSLSFDAAEFSFDRTHGACWVQLTEKATGTPVVFASIHLINGQGASFDGVRQRETRAVTERIAAQFGADARVVLAGDFNSSRSRSLDGPAVAVAERGLQDAYDQAASYDSMPFLNSACLPMPRVCTSYAWGDHVDRVFAPRGAHVAAWKVDYRLAGSQYASPLISDHNPVLASLLLPVG